MGHRSVAVEPPQVVPKGVLGGGLRSRDISTVETRVSAPFGSAEIRRLHLTTPLDNVLHTGRGYWIEMSLTGRQGSPRVRYQHRWRPHRFEGVGGIMVLSGNEPVQGLSGPCTGTSVVCRITPEAARQWVGRESTWSDQQLISMLDLTNPAVRCLMTRLATELRAPGLAQATMVEMIAGQLMIELYRSQQSSSERCGGGLAGWQLRLVDEHLREKLHDVGLSDLAALCGISVRHLTRAFRVSKGCSLGAYIAQKRMEHAQAALIEGQTIKAIAPRLGFSSVASFTSAFKRDLGVSPAAFRASVR